jgi:putative flippase GtrA
LERRTAYVFNRRWTFRAHGSPATLARYLAVVALGALFSALGVTLASTDFSLRRLAAECLVVPVITLFTYTFSHRLVFHDAWGASGATGSP